MPLHTIEFRRTGNAIALAEQGDPLEAGQRILATIEVTTMQMSRLFDRDALRDALMVFVAAYDPQPNRAQVDLQYLAPVVRSLRRMIIGAGMGAAVLGGGE